MKNVILALSFLVCMATAAQNSPSQNSFPPEWEPHKSVWLGWQPWEVDSAFCKVQCEMAQVISPHTPLTLLFSSSNMKGSAFQRLYTYGVDTSKIKSYYVPIENIWIRDAGLVF
jgi:agmatine/peptidylarginine deiminase